MKQPSAYLKMRVLGAVETAEGKTHGERIKKVSGLIFTDEEGNSRNFSWRTIQTWHYRYKNQGITAITTNIRCDKGKPRKIMPEEVMEAINSVLPYFRDKGKNKMNIYRLCIEKGILNKKQIGRTTFYRFVKKYDLLKSADGDNKKRLAFSMQYVNQLWQADTMFGPYVKTNNKPKQTKLIAFIDDASRLICHGEFFFEENINSLVKSLKAAFYKRGVPEQLYVDNGSIYCSKEITLVCARTGCILSHTAVKDASAKGKIERFFRRVRDQFLPKNLDLSSLDKLNQQFTNWTEQEYNGSNHSSIGMKPIDRFGLDLQRIRFLPPSEANDELFYAEVKRKVKKDNTFSFKGKRYETPVDLRGKEITIRYEREMYNSVVVYYDGDRMGNATLLDVIANGLLRRKGEGK